MSARDQLARIEAAAVRSWPALETADIDGWLWRHASDGSLRANSVSALRAGEVVASGLSVADGPLASVQCMTTLAGARRQGCAQSILSAIEAWAATEGCTHLYLQVETANGAAITLYESFGFAVAGSYHLRMKS